MRSRSMRLRFSYSSMHRSMLVVSFSSSSCRTLGRRDLLVAMAAGGLLWAGDFLVCWVLDFVAGVKVLNGISGRTVDLLSSS